MTPGVSVIIPVAGVDELRNRNFLECLKSLEAQLNRNFEIIVVEQSLDSKYYKEWVKDRGIKWVGIKDSKNRGFNLSWCRNVGAKIAIGQKIVLMDADMVFEQEYIDRVLLVKSPFAGGAKTYHWINSEDITGRFIPTRDFKYVYESSLVEDLVRIFRFTPFTRGCGYGAVLVFDRLWYLNDFGGYIEDFFKYGWEDKAAVEIIRDLLGYREDSEFEKVDYDIIHLSHFSKDMRNMKNNESLFMKISTMDKKQLAKDIKNAGVGFLESPNPLNINFDRHGRI